MGHFQPDLIADDETDEPFAHFSGDMSQHFVTVAQFHAKHGAREYGADDTVKFDGFILVVGAFFTRADLGRGGTAKAAATGTAATATTTTTATRTTTTATRSGTVMPATTLR